MVREKVKKNAPWFIYDFQELLDVLHQDSGQRQKRETETNGVGQVLESEPLTSGAVCSGEIKVEAS